MTQNEHASEAENPVQTESISVEDFYTTFHAVSEELGNTVIGQDEPVRHILTSMFSAGHILLKGFPGLGRTLIAKTLAQVMGLKYGRIQFTPDLLPTDITGTEVLEQNAATGERRFHFFKGPVFANLVLADEVNRSPARTQAALLEVMQERQVSVGGETFYLPDPFILIATQNTLDSEGVFSLGEAQVDRFLVMVEQDFPKYSEEMNITYTTTGPFSHSVKQITSPETIIAMQKLAREVPVVPSVKEFALTLVRASRSGEEGSAEEIRHSIRLGASPRATQGLILMGKVTALSRGRFHVTRQDIIDVAIPVLGHRILMDFRAQAEGLQYREIIHTLIDKAKAMYKPTVSMWTRELLKE